MSQNFLTTTTASGLSIEFNAGYDRMLGELFASANVLSDFPEEGEASEQTERELEIVTQMQAECPDNAEQIAYAFGLLGVTLPRSMLDAIEDDRRENRGNLVRIFAADGPLLEAKGVQG